MTVYCTTPAVLRLENTDASGNVVRSLDLMDQANGFRVSSLELAWPEVREVKAALPTRDGDYDTTALFGPRVVTVIGSVVPAALSRQASLAALAWWVQPALRPRLVYAVDPAVPALRIGLRGQQLGAPFTNPAVSAFTVSWVAPDPAAYNSAGSEITVNPGTSAPGRLYNLVYNRTYGVAGPGGYGTCTNNGSYQTWPVFTVYGPCTNPSVYYQAPAVGQIVFNGLTVNAGDFVRVDTRAASVLYNGQAGASRYSTLDFTQTLWAPFQPGTTGILFQPASSSGACHLVADWADAYLT